MSTDTTTGTGPTPAPAAVPLRRNRDFLLLWTGVGASLLGSRAAAVSYGLLVLAHTGSGARAGLVTSAALLPSLLVQLPAGALVDRWDRRRLMIGCDLGRAAALATVVLAVAAGHVWLPQLIAVAFVEGSLALVHQLAERGAVRNVVPEEQLGAALSQNEARGRAAGLLGGPLGSVLFALGRSWPFLFAVVSHLVSLAGLLMIRTSLQEQRPAGPRRLGAELKEGIAWVRGQRFLRIALATVAGANVLFQVLILTVPFILVKEEGRSPGTVGVVLAVSGVGGMLGALSARWWMPRLSLRAVLIGSTVLWALLMPVMALARDPFTLGALFAAMNYVGGVLNVLAAVYQIRITPDALQGRAGATAGLLVSGASTAGALLGGFLLDALGSGRVALAAGLAMAVIAAAAALAPTVRNATGRATAD
ncbi:MFS transporter [Kitasatospora sp. NPDC054939]